MERGIASTYVLIACVAGSLCTSAAAEVDVPTTTVAVGHARPIQSLDISPDGSRILYVSCETANCQYGDQSLRVIDAQGRPIASIPNVREWRSPQFLDRNTIYAAHPSRGGRFVVAHIEAASSALEYRDLNVSQGFALGTLEGREVYATFEGYGLRFDRQSVLSREGFVYSIKDLADGHEIFRAQYPVLGSQWLRLSGNALWFEALVGHAATDEMSKRYRLLHTRKADNIGRGVHHIVGMMPLMDSDGSDSEIFAALSAFNARGGNVLQNQRDPRAAVSIVDMGRETALFYVQGKGLYRYKDGKIASITTLGPQATVGAIADDGAVVVMNDRWKKADAKLGDSIAIVPFQP